jgi:hypothetical protein
MDFHRARRFITAALLLLSPAAAPAQTADENFVEVGVASLDEAGGKLSLGPRLKIFRDGRVLVVDAKGVWEGRVEREQIEDLERDLLRSPLLVATRFIQARHAKPGGVSYIRFRDGAGEVVIASEGRPVDREWRTVVERIEAEQPTTLIGPAQALLERDAPGRAALEATLSRLRQR